MLEIESVYEIERNNRIKRITMSGNSKIGMSDASKILLDEETASGLKSEKSLESAIDCLPCWKRIFLKLSLCRVRYNGLIKMFQLIFE